MAYFSNLKCPPIRQINMFVKHLRMHSCLSNFEENISRNCFTNLQCVHYSSAFLTTRLNSYVSNKILKVGPCASSVSQRYLCDSNNGNDPHSLNQDSRVLPRRVIKRLQKQGITEKEYLKELEILSKSDQKPTVNSKDELELLLKSTSITHRDISELDSFPSDVVKHRQWKRQDHERNRPPTIAPSTTSVVLFPGQGSQFVGMGQKLLHYPGVLDLYDEASSILGYDLLEMCLHGPKATLDKTVHCQPAVMITSLAAIERLREQYPKAVENCIATAGFSVGEITALVFSGVLSFPDAVKLIKVRAESMQKASEKVSSGMLTVFLAHDSDLKGAIQMAKEYCQSRCGIEEPICQVANYLFPECKVLAGHSEALEFISTNCREFNILRTRRLAVSGAFHTQLMKSAKKPMEKYLQKMQLGTPKIPIHSNLTGGPYPAKTHFVHKLQEHLVKPVLWEQTLHKIYKRPQGLEFPNTYEVGPGKQMGTLLKQVNLQAHKQYKNIDV